MVMMIWGGKVTDKTDEIFRRETVSLISIQTIVICHDEISETSCYLFDLYRFCNHPDLDQAPD